MTRDEIFDHIVEILSSSFEIPKESIERSSTLYEALGLDSVDAVDIFMQLRELTGRRPNQADARKVRTVDELIDFVLAEREKAAIERAGGTVPVEPEPPSGETPRN